MKRFLLISGLFAAFLCLTQNANAQYAQIHRDGSRFVDNAGITLSDQELIDLVGDDVYFDTVVGARKQYNAGRRLVRGGAISAGVGLTSMLGGTALMLANSTGRSHYYDYDYDQIQDYFEGDETGLAIGVLLFAGGYVATIAGGIVLTAGIPLKVIGQSRLNWVENDFNERSRRASLRFGAAPSGVGLTLKF